MKRRPKAPLFKPLEPAVYVIDTSAWLDVDTRKDADEVWGLIVDLIGEGRIVACSTVLDEIQDEGFYMQRIFPYEAALRAGDRNDVEYLLHVGKVTGEHPAMAKATGMKNPADPYVVALAEIEDYVVVADETCRKRPNRKIPGVCQKRGIKCKTLDELIADVRAEAVVSIG